MGIWDSISNGEIPSIDDVVESGTNAYEGASNAVDSAGEAISDGAQYVADGAVELAHDAYGAGERAVDTVGGEWDAAWDRHYDRNDNNYSPGSAPLPAEVGAPNADGWRRMSTTEAAFHQDPSTPGEDLKYVHPDGGEYVVDQNGREVTNGAYEGTYNYVTPTAWDGVENLDDYVGSRAGHFAYDVLPWFLEGSVRDDHPDNAEEGSIWDRTGGPLVDKATEAVGGGLSRAGDAISDGASTVGTGINDAYDYLTDW